MIKSEDCTYDSPVLTSGDLLPPETPDGMRIFADSDLAAAVSNRHPRLPGKVLGLLHKLPATPGGISSRPEDLLVVAHDPEQVNSGRMQWMGSIAVYRLSEVRLKPRR